MNDTTFIQLVILGGTGDLAIRKLIPSLYSLYEDNLLPQKFKIISVARRELDNEEYEKYILEKYHKYTNTKLDRDNKWVKFYNHIEYVSGNFNESESYNILKSKLDLWDKEHKVCSDKVIYFSTAPEFFYKIIDGIKSSNLHKECKKSHVRLVVEKPFGNDEKSSKRLDDKISEVFSEDRVYRIDHVLGKDPLVDIISLRRFNPLVEALLKSSEIDHIQISYLESIGVEERAEFYDQTGVINDMVQNHILQIIALFTMKIPNSINHKTLSKAKVKVLESLGKVEEKDLVLGQYDGSKGNSSYQEDIGKRSNTPTFVSFKTTVKYNNKKIPIYVRTGKRLAKKVTEVDIVFKYDDSLVPNMLSFRIQPDSGIYLVLKKRDHKNHSKRENIVLDYCYTDRKYSKFKDAYENLLYQVINGDNTYFVNIKEVQASWKFVGKIHKMIEEKKVKLRKYKSGTFGPEESKKLILKNGYDWYPERFNNVCKIR